MRKAGFLYCDNGNCKELITEVPLEKILKNGEDKAILTCPKCGTKYEVSNVEYEYDM